MSTLLLCFLKDGYDNDDDEEEVITLHKMSYYLLQSATKLHQQFFDMSILRCTSETTSDCNLSTKTKPDAPCRPNFSSFSDTIKES